MLGNSFSFLYPNGTFLTDEGSFLVTAPNNTPNGVTGSHIRRAPATSSVMEAEALEEGRSDDKKPAPRSGVKKD